MLRLSCLASLMSLCLGAVAIASPVQISVTNHQSAKGFYFTPVFTAFHDGGFDLFDSGTAASAGLEALAEEGNVAPLTSILGLNADGTARASTVVVSPGGFAGAPVFDPGETQSLSFDVANASSNRYLTFGSMVIPSNDAFFGNGNATAHEVFAADGTFNGPFTIQIFGSSIYDAGTEVNDRQGAAFSAIGGASNDENGVVALHPGLENFLNSSTAAGTMIGSGIDSGELLATIEVSQANAVPEPSTLAVWGVLALLGGVYVRRNRK